MLLEGKVAIVTGASRGIGKAIALKLAREGADVCVISLSDRGEETKKEIEALGRKAAFYRCDVSNYEEVKEVVKNVKQEFEKIDILVNNAGVTKDTLLIRMKEEDWDYVMNVNLKGTFFFTKEVINIMRKQKRGSIINISSVVGLMGNVGQANYCASKSGIIGFSKAVAREYAGYGIRVNVVAPGFIETDMTSQIPEKIKEEFLKQIPMKRIGSPEEVANVVKFLASDDASYITGEVISVNGGLYM